MPKTRSYTISNSPETRTSQLLTPPILTNLKHFLHSQTLLANWNSNIPITQTANSHKSETLLASRNTSHNPKHFSQSETLLANRNTSCPHRDLNPGLIAPQFTALSTRPLATFCHMRWKQVDLNYLFVKKPQQRRFPFIALERIS